MFILREVHFNTQSGVRFASAVPLKEDNQLMGNIFGLRIGRNRDKVLEEAVNNMIRLIEADEQLTAEWKQMLKEAMAQALKG